MKTVIFRTALLTTCLVWLSYIHSELPGQTWETVNTEGEPLARHEAAFIEFDNKFYLLGGRRIQPVSIYDPATNSWHNASQPPIEIHHFQPVVWRDRIVIIGALSGKYPREMPVDRVLEYYPSTDTWNWSHAIPAARQRGAAGVVNVADKIYISCGIINGHVDGWVSWMDRYDPATGEWTQLNDAPRVRDHFQSAHLNGLIYNAGGRRTSQKTKQVFQLVIPEVDVYDLANDSWSTLPKPLPTPRAGNSTVATYKHIVVAGGESGSQKKAHSEVEAWNIVLETWLRWPNLNTGRHGTGLILHNNYIHTCSGCANRGGKPEITSMERLPIGQK